jgi:hypothetical protein
VRHVDNDGIHVAKIMGQTACPKHGADKQMPCWFVYSDSNSNRLPALCGARIRKAGYNGAISPTSNQSNKSSGVRRPNGRQR